MFSVLLFLDTSGSMHGEKIFALSYAVERFIHGLRDIAFSQEPMIASFTFGGKLTQTPFVPLSQLALWSIEARGATLLSEALTKAQTLAASSTVCVLISDGLVTNGDFAKIRFDCQKYAIAVGSDADKLMLSRFTGANERVFPTYESEMLPGYILQREYNTMERSNGILY